VAGSLHIIWRWNGSAMEPLERFRPYCEKLVPGKEYRLAPRRERSRKSHNHFFACVAETWANLPECSQRDYPSELILRKWALVQVGYCKELKFKAYDQKAAEDFAAQCAGLDDYVEIEARGNGNGVDVTIRMAKSQAEEAMDGPEFQQCKDRVFTVLAQLIGVDPTELHRMAREHP